MNRELLQQYRNTEVMLLMTPHACLPFILNHTLYDVKYKNIISELTKYKLVCFTLNERYIVYHRDTIIHQNDSVTLCKKYIKYKEERNNDAYYIFDVSQFYLWFQDNKQTKDIRWCRVWHNKLSFSHPESPACIYKKNTVIRGVDGNKWKVKEIVKKNGTIDKKWVITGIIV